MLAKTPTTFITKSSAGFTLMEVLATLVILSIGLLGVASLQLNALRGNMNAMETSVAVALAVEATDRIRANVPGVTGDNYRFIDSAGSDPGCISAGCTPAQVAQTDAFEWITKVETQLPGGVGVICWDSTPNDGEGGHISSSTPWNPMCDGDATAGIIAVKVGWDHDRDSGGEDRGERDPGKETDFVVYRMSIRP